MIRLCPWHQLSWCRVLEKLQQITRFMITSGMSQSLAMLAKIPSKIGAYFTSPQNSVVVSMRCSEQDNQAYNGREAAEQDDNMETNIILFLSALGIGSILNKAVIISI